jgi:branched-chain amino acid transport system permease protein
MAYGMFYTIGAYVTWYMIQNYHLSYLPAFIIGVSSAGIIGLLSYILIFRRLQHVERGFLATLIASMGLSMVLSQSSLLFFGTVPRSVPVVFKGAINISNIHITNDRLALIGISVAVTLFLFWVYEKTALGRAMRAVAYLPETASLQGINTDSIFLMALTIGCVLAGFAGGILAPSYGMTPDMGNNVLWTVMLMTMLGGIDSLLGAVAAGVLIGQILSFGQFLIGGTVQIITFLLIGLILYFRPIGLLGRGTEIQV